MKAFIFPGQGAQYPGMGKDLYDHSRVARELFQQADDLLGFSITRIMFEGSIDDLKQTRVTQPAIFIHSVVLSRIMEGFDPAMVAGHSLGEFSALTAAGALTFEEGLLLVQKRAMAMQKACEVQPSGMAAVIGLDDDTVTEVCASIPELVVPANYNCPGQVVISGSLAGIDKACELLPAHGAKRIMKLVVGGAFHSPLMEPAHHELAEAIRTVKMTAPRCPVYQNVTASPSSDPETISHNLVMQLTAPVLWTRSVQQMVRDGATSFMEVGPGKVLQGMVKKIAPEVEVSGIETVAEGNR